MYCQCWMESSRRYEWNDSKPVAYFQHAASVIGMPVVMNFLGYLTGYTISPQTQMTRYNPGETWQYMNTTIPAHCTGSPCGIHAIHVRKNYSIWS